MAEGRPSDFGSQDGREPKKFRAWFLIMPGLFCRLSATFWRPTVRTICTPFSAFWGLFVSGFPLSKMAALGEEKPLSRPFIINKLTALGTLSFRVIMSHCHSYNLSACLAIDHRTCHRSALPPRAALALILSYNVSLKHRACQENNAARCKGPCSRCLDPPHPGENPGLLWFAGFSATGSMKNLR